MYKKILPVLAIVFITAIISGCSASNPPEQAVDSANATTGTELNQPGDQTASGTPRVDNRIKGSITDLKVGSKIMVMGTANQDGSIGANEIMFSAQGGPAFGWGDFSTSTRPTGTRQFTSSQPSDGQSLEGGRSGNGEGNWNGRLGANGGQRPSGQRPNRMQGVTRLMGEILEIDETSLIVKLDEGGSKIVYYSDKTGVYTMKPPIEENN
jgi:hypothetical protein